MIMIMKFHFTKYLLVATSAVLLFLCAPAKPSASDVKETGVQISARTTDQQPGQVPVQMPLQIQGLIDLRTTFSDGAYSVEELVRRAKQKGFGALVINDHDRLCLEYGLPPFRNLIKKRWSSIRSMSWERTNTCRPSGKARRCIPI